jgi:hypothetical protein
MLLDVAADAVQQLLVRVAARRAPELGGEQRRDQVQRAVREAGAGRLLQLLEVVAQVGEERGDDRADAGGAAEADGGQLPHGPRGQLDAAVREHHHERAEVVVERERVRAARVVHRQVAGAQHRLPAVLHQHPRAGEHEADLERRVVVVRRLLRGPFDDVLPAPQVADVHVVDGHRAQHTAERARGAGRQVQREEGIGDRGPVGLECRRHVRGERAGHRRPLILLGATSTSASARRE